MKTRILAVLNFVFFIFHLVTSYFVQKKVFSSMDVGEVSLKYDTVFTPAPVTFSIWGLIYLSLFAFCIYHLYKAFTETEAQQANSDTTAIGTLFIINNIATALWLLAWVNEMLLISVILILIQLMCLILISLRAHISNPYRSATTKVFTHFPLSIYFGWISVATIANISAYLKAADWYGMPISDDSWAIIMIGFATLMTVFVIVVRRNLIFGLVVLWALYGIILKRNQLDPVPFESVMNAAWAAFAVIVIALAIRLIKQNEPDDTLAGA